MSSERSPFLDVLPLSLDAMIDDVFRAKRRQPPITIGFVNAHSRETAQNQQEARSALKSLDYPLPDGILMNLALRLEGREVNARYTGVDLLEGILGKGGGRHFFFGASNEALRRIRARIATDYDVEAVAGLSPPLWPWPARYDRTVCSEIESFGADYVWVGLTAPKQEIWMYRNAQNITARGIVAIGYAFDTFAGLKNRAPPAVRRYGLEWLYRFAHNPLHSWRRIFITAPQFAFRVSGRQLSQRFGNGRNDK